LKTVAVTERLGWLSRTVEKEVWITRTADALVVFSATCPHEACTVQSAAPSRIPDTAFVCLCHRSRFAFDGAVIEGPALRGLDTLEHRVEGGELLARYRKFSKQVREKVVLS
jgi:Rieske Fe-S protein